MNEKVVQKPTPKGVNVPKPIPARPSAEKLLFDFLKENNIVLTFEPLNSKVRSLVDGGILIDKPKVGAKYG